MTVIEEYGITRKIVPRKRPNPLEVEKVGFECYRATVVNSDIHSYPMREDVMTSLLRFHRLIILCTVAGSLVYQPGNTATSQEHRLRLWPDTGGRVDSAGEITTSTDMVRITNVHVPDILV